MGKHIIETHTVENHLRTVPYYVVATNPEKSAHHGLRENTAPHLLTKRPTAGDQIVHTFDVAMECEPSGLAVGATVYQVGFRLERHPGRSASLGEDGIEDAFDGDALGGLIEESLSGATWTYAPCAFIRRPEEPSAGERWNVQRHFARNADGSWREETD